MGSRLPPLVLATAALAAAGLGLRGLALWLGLGLVVAAAAAAFVAVSDVLEGEPARLRAVTSSLALALVVLGSAAKENAPAGASVSRLATYALVSALVVYSVPVVAWVLVPVRVPRRTPRRRRLRPAEVEELLSRAA